MEMNSLDLTVDTTHSCTAPRIKKLLTKDKKSFQWCALTGSPPIGSDFVPSVVILPDSEQGQVVNSANLDALLLEGMKTGWTEPDGQAAPP